MADQPQPVDQPRDPSLTAVLELQAEVIKESIHVMLPGKIVSYDATKQQAVVQPLVKHRFLAEDGTTIVTEDLPQIHDVPVLFCGPARGRITWPVDAGDICEIRFASASLARWVKMSAGSTVDPGDDRRHDLSDAVCFVGLHSPAGAPTDAPQNAIVLHVSGGNTIKLGSSSANQAAIKGTSYWAAESTVMAALSVAFAAISTFAGFCVGPTSGQLAALTGAMTTVENAIAAFTGGSYLSIEVLLE